MLARPSTRQPCRFVDLLLLVLLLSATTTRAQSAEDYYAGDDYQDYADPYGGPQDNLYADYAAHQQEKMAGGGGGGG